MPHFNFRAILLRHWAASRLQPLPLFQEENSPTLTKHPNAMPASERLSR